MPTNPLESMFRAYAAEHPSDAAKALETLSPAEAGELIQPLAARLAGPVLEHVNPAAAAAILTSLGPAATRSLLMPLAPRHAASILHNFDAAAREAALDGLGGDRTRRIRGLLEYPADSAGGMMNTQITSLRVDLTVAQAIARLRRARRTTLFYLYVTDQEGKLTGVLNVRELLLASPRDPIEPMVNHDLVMVPATMRRDELTDLVRERHFIALPVVDDEGYLLGVVKTDQIIDAIGEEAFGDIQKMVGAGGDERALSPVSLVVQKRLPWLYINLLTAFLAAAVVGLFEGTIEKVTALAVLLPVVAGQGGNTGAQSLAIVMRGMALRELLPGSTQRLLVKETLAAFVNGVAVAVGTGIGVYIWDGRVALVAVIGGAMIVNMTAAGLAGAVIPLMLRALGRDPAQSSSIFLTTVTDIVGFAAFLGFAALCLPWLT